MPVITVPKELREVLGEKGADALVKVINDADLSARKDLALKEDFAKVKEEILKVEHRLEVKIERVEAKIDKVEAKIDKVEVKLDAKIDRVEAKLSERMTFIDGEIRLQKWMLGILLAGVISLIMKAFFIP
ncbi:MAG: hypothetical protein L3V56_07595 [Candidatus Magnetoovum sp. WYHC-5]|nr:hypothetical protein [Candidatus Magnetoovum sp. WYHC-5]